MRDVLVNAWLTLEFVSSFEWRKYSWLHEAWMAGFFSSRLYQSFIPVNHTSRYEKESDCSTQGKPALSCITKKLKTTFQKTNSTVEKTPTSIVHVHRSWEYISIKVAYATWNIVTERNRVVVSSVSDTGWQSHAKSFQPHVHTRSMLFTYRSHIGDWTDSSQ